MTCGLVPALYYEIANSLLSECYPVGQDGEYRVAQRQENRFDLFNLIPAHSHRYPQQFRVYPQATGQLYTIYKKKAPFMPGN